MGELNLKKENYKNYNGQYIRLNQRNKQEQGAPRIACGHPLMLTSHKWGVNDELMIPMIVRGKCTLTDIALPHLITQA